MAKNSVKFPLDPCSIVHGWAWCKLEFFHDRRWHTVKTQVVGAEAVDMSCLVWRQMREDFGRGALTHCTRTLFLKDPSTACLLE
jgi:hypothetical protein